MAKARVTEEQLMLARMLYRTDKWDPARDQAEAFAWEELRENYVDRATRLLRTFDKEGYSMVRESERTAA